MVAVTVGLVALAGSIVFNLGDEINEPLSASVQTSLNDGKIDVSVIRNDNVDRIFVRDIEGSILESRDISGGRTATFTAIPTGGGLYQVTAESDGREQVIRSYEVASVRISMTLGGTISSDAKFDIEHIGGDQIEANDMQVWVDASDACGKSERIINLPATESGPKFNDSNVDGGDIGSSIIDGSSPSISTGSNWVFAVIHEDSTNYNGGLYESGESLGFSIAETDCDLDAGDKVEVSVVDNSDTPVIVGCGVYEVGGSPGAESCGDSSSSVNLLSNPSFESGSGADADSWDESDTAGSGRDSSFSKDDSYSIAMKDLTSSYGGRKLASDPISVSGGENYDFGAYYYLPSSESDFSGTSASDYRYKIELVWLDSSGSEISEYQDTADISGFDSWNKVTFTDNSPSSAVEARLVISTKEGINNDGNVYWDSSFIKES